MHDGMTTVFYVDDNARSRRLLGSVLAECGFEMITASDPIEALCRCEKIGFDLALLDYQMPSLTGSQLALEIKFLMPDVPIVLLSGCTVLPPTELAFVDAHFGPGTHFDDLVDAMHRLTKSTPPGISHTLADKLDRLDLDPSIFTKSAARRPISHRQLCDSLPQRWPLFLAVVRALQIPRYL